MLLAAGVSSMSEAFQFGYNTAFRCHLLPLSALQAAASH